MTRFVLSLCAIHLGQGLTGDGERARRLNQAGAALVFEPVALSFDIDRRGVMQESIQDG
jgi:hypothetical protein